MAGRLYATGPATSRTWERTIGTIGAVAPASAGPKAAAAAQAFLSGLRHGKPAHVWTEADWTFEGEEIAVIRAVSSFPERPALESFVRRWAEGEE